MTILRAGGLPPDLVGTKGDYGVFIRAMLGTQFTYREVDVLEDPLPTVEFGDEAFVITGSSASVYSPDSWIERLRCWVRQKPAANPLLGICFGHQLVAHAFGANVGRSSDGAFVGVRRLSVPAHPLLGGAPAHFGITSWHYDQVLSVPDFAEAVGSSSGCPIGLLLYPKLNVLSFQGHPELGADLIRYLHADWRQKGLLSGVLAAKDWTDAAFDRDVLWSRIRTFMLQRRTRVERTASLPA